MISKKRATIFPDDDDVVLDGGGGGGGGFKLAPDFYLKWSRSKEEKQFTKLRKSTDFFRIQSKLSIFDIV